MNKAKALVAAITITLALFASGCNWSVSPYSLAALPFGVIVLDNDNDGGCDEWYDFADPGCW